MSLLSRAQLDEIGQHLSDDPSGAVSVGVLAQRMGISVATAGRRLKAWAKAHQVTLQSIRAREGERGPPSARWYIASSAPRRPEPQPKPTPEPAALPAALLAPLTPDERQALRVLATLGTARTSELAAQLGRSGDRTEGLLRTLRRKLHRLGTPLIDNQTLPDGEALFRFSGPSAP